MSQVLLENSKAGFILVMGVKIAIFGSKTPFLGSDTSGFEVYNECTDININF